MHDGTHGAPRLPEPRFNQRKDVFLINQIEVVRRFVENENLRILGEHLRQKRALQFAAGERQHAGAAQGKIGDVMTAERLQAVYEMDVYGWMREMLGQWA